MEQNVGLGRVVVVDLEGVNVDDGVGDVGQRRPEVVDPPPDGRRTVPHHEPDALKLETYFNLCFSLKFFV